MYGDFIRERIVKLRMERGVSAREMSLSMGQSASYVNNIENRRARPSLTGLFYICEYFGITPWEFFEEGNEYPQKLRAITDSLKNLDERNLAIVAQIASILARK